MTGTPHVVREDDETMPAKEIDERMLRLAEELGRLAADLFLEGKLK